MKNVTFISQVPVPPKDEDAFLYACQGVHRILRTKPGFASARAWRGLGSDVSSVFVVAFEFDTSAHLTGALSSPEVLELRKSLPWKGEPAIFEPVAI